MKRPSFQFYPSDWLNDAKLKLSDWEVQGLWMQLLCYMHNESDYGYLCIDDRYLDENEIQRLLNANPKRFNRVFKSLKTLGIIRVDDKGFYSKRMVEDERLRRVRAESGSKGGNPNLVNQTDKQNNKQKQTPSSSSTSSSSSSTKTTPQPPEGEFPGFEKFWEAYPSYENRKAKRPECLKRWKNRNLEKIADEILLSLEAYKATESWTKENCKYIQAPLTFINGSSWETPISTPKQNGSFTKPVAAAPSQAQLDKQHREYYNLDRLDAYLAAEVLVSTAYEGLTISGKDLVIKGIDTLVFNKDIVMGDRTYYRAGTELCWTIWLTPEALERRNQAWKSLTA